MNPNETMDLPTLLALREQQGPEALKTITDRLRVEDMGPADHIRTKHEVKAFLDSGDPKAAEALLRSANDRLTRWQHEAVRLAEQQGQRLGQ